MYSNSLGAFVFNGKIIAIIVVGFDVHANKCMLILDTYDQGKKTFWDVNVNIYVCSSLILISIDYNRLNERNAIDLSNAGS